MVTVSASFASEVLGLNIQNGLMFAGLAFLQLYI